jgi:intracellular multiplication protein IcmB
MSLSTKLVSSLDVLLSQIKRSLYHDIQDYCFLETATDPHYFTAHDGSLVTIMSIKGIRKIVDKREQAIVAKDLYKKIKTHFKHSGHSLQFVYSKDSQRTKDKLTELIAPFARESKKMQMDSDFLFKDKINNLLNFTCYEDNYLVFWSRPTLIESSIKSEQEEYNEDVAKTSLYEKSQNIMLNYKSLENIHKKVFNIIQASLKTTGISFETLKVNEKSNVIKSAINSELVSSKWRARLANKRPVMRDNDSDIGIKENDISYLMYPNLKKQLIPDSFTKVNDNTVKIDNRYITSMYVDIPQEEPTPFFELIEYIDRTTPFQISFKIEGGGLNNIGLKKFLSAILAWSPGSNNKLIKESLEEFSRLDLADETITKNGISVNTWADDEDTLNRRRQELMKALQSWGSQGVLSTNDDPYEGMLNSIPAFFPKIVGNNYLQKMDYVLYTLPLTRQANIWEEGCIINRTLDGKIMPYQVASKKQASWNELIFAKPGSGKSVWGNFSNFSFSITPKSSKLAAGKLPFIGIIDIGPSSSGLIRLFHNLLPPQKRKEAVYYKLSNSVKDAINVFDTQLGARFPTEKEKSFLIRFLSLLLTPAGSRQIASMDAMINNVITALYKTYADTNKPKIYEEFRDERIDRLVQLYDLKATERSWWWIADELFKRDEFEGAKIAQRYAVPKLEDAIKICNSDQNITSQYKKPIVQQTSENMVDYFIRVLNENINLYPILNEPTRLDLDEARVISLDLNDVAPDGDATAKKQSGIFYMLARFVVTRNFFLDKNLPEIVPELYKTFQLERSRENYATPKRFCIDELHRTNGISDFRNQIKQDMREGRKWNLSICLISQLIEDFDDQMIDLCNSKFILSGGDNYKKIVKKFDLTGEIADKVRTDLNGPTSEGVPFVVKFSTKKGEYTQFLYNTLSSMERWAFSSTAEDNQIREMCDKVFGSQLTLRILSETFPEGSIGEKVEELMNSSLGEEISSPIDYFMEKLKSKYKDKIKL